MKIHKKIRSIRKSKGWSQEKMAEKLELSVNGYANIERGETDVQVSRLEQIAETFRMELLEFFNFGERNVFYLVSEIDFSPEKNEFEHELEKARLLLHEKEKENNYLKEIIASLMKN